MFLSETGILPPYRDAHQFVLQQRCEHFNDLKHVLKVMRKISDEDEVPFKLSMMYLLDEGALRFVKIPKVRMFNVHISVLIHCVVPEIIHTHPTEGHWKFLEGGGS